MLDEVFMAKAKKGSARGRRRVGSFARNGKIMKNSNRCRKKNGSLCTRNGRKEGIEWSCEASEDLDVDLFPVSDF